MLISCCTSAPMSSIMSPTFPKHSSACCTLSTVTASNSVNSLHTSFTLSRSSSEYLMFLLAA